MFCNKCGSEVNEGANFCNKCGNNMGTTGATPTAPAMDGNFVSDVSDKVTGVALLIKTKKKHALIAAAVAVVVIVAVIVCAVIMPKIRQENLDAIQSRLDDYADSISTLNFEEAVADYYVPGTEEVPGDIEDFIGGFFDKIGLIPGFDIEEIISTFGFSDVSQLSELVILFDEISSDFGEPGSKVFEYTLEVEDSDIELKGKTAEMSAEITCNIAIFFDFTEDYIIKMEKQEDVWYINSIEPVD